MGFEKKKVRIEPRLLDVLACWNNGDQFVHFCMYRSLWEEENISEVWDNMVVVPDDLKDGLDDRVKTFQKLIGEGDGGEN